MAIIISKNGKNAKRVDKTLITKEGYLQKYIYDNPESIPMKDDVQLLILAREFPTDSGPIDAVGIDKNGEIYLIETKLYKNPDKRLVVAQVLDYGAALWHAHDADDFFELLRDKVNDTFKVSIEQHIKDFYKEKEELEDDDIEGLIENLKRNVEKGKFRFVVLMDTLSERLKNLIIFINENSYFDIYAVEVEYYKHDEYEILIPKLFGAESAKVDGGGSGRGKWDANKFFSTAAESVGQGAPYKLLQDIYNFTTENAELDWGTGTKSGSFTYKFSHPSSKSGFISLFTVWTEGVIRFRYQNVKKNLGKDAADQYLNKLSILPISKNWKKEVLEKYGPSATLQEAFPDDNAFESFKKAILQFMGETHVQ